MEYIQEITLELNTLTAPVIIGAKQGEVDSRGIKVNYTKNGEPYLINENNFVRLRIRKPDNTSILNDAINNRDGTITVIFSYQCLSAAGRAYADLTEFNTSGQILSTASFVIDIQAAPDISYHNALSSDEFQSLLNFINQGQEVIGLAQSWANGYNGETPLGPSSNINTIPGDDNNAKYWANQASLNGEAWANGTRNQQAIPSTDPAYNKNAKYWADQTKAYLNALEFTYNATTGILSVTVPN